MPMLVSAFALATLLGCEKKERIAVNDGNERTEKTEEKEGKDNAEGPGEALAALLGTWMAPEDGGKTLTLTFEGEGTGRAVTVKDGQKDEEVEFTWTLQGNNLTVTFKDARGESEKSTTGTFDGAKLTLNMGGKAVEFTKATGNGDPSGSRPSGSEATHEKDLLGTWTASNPNGAHIELTFNEKGDGTIAETNAGKTNGGPLAWTLNGNTLSITLKGQNGTQDQDVTGTFDGKKLTIENIEFQRKKK